MPRVHGSGFQCSMLRAVSAGCLRCPQGVFGFRGALPIGGSFGSPARSAPGTSFPITIRFLPDLGSPEDRRFVFVLFSFPGNQTAPKPRLCRRNRNRIIPDAHFHRTLRSPPFRSLRFRSSSRDNSRIRRGANWSLVSVYPAHPSLASSWNLQSGGGIKSEDTLRLFLRLFIGGADWSLECVSPGHPSLAQCGYQ
jgi:hypothetical protein